jgi:molecular chaperone DnaK
MVEGYVGRTLELVRRVLTAAGLGSSDISEVVCVGGSTRIPMVRQRLAELFGKAPMTSINPDEVVAHGAAIQAGSLSGALVDGGMASSNAVATAATSPLVRGGSVGGAMGTPLVRPVLLDVAPASLGIATIGGFTEKLLEKNSPIPIERTRTFATGHDDQVRVAIDCCRGEARKYAENEPLGQLVLSELTPRPRGATKIDVTFRIDTDGILHVRAADADTGAAQVAQLSMLGAPSAPSEG